MFLKSLFPKFKIGVDLGTSNTLVYIAGKGIKLIEPSVIALRKDTQEIIAFGKEAKKMIGRTPPNIVAIKPLINGVVSDFEATMWVFKLIIERFANTFKNIIMVVAIPPEITEVQKKAVIDAAKNAGADKVYLIVQNLAAAIGSNLNIEEAKGILLVDIGGGTTDIGVISLGGLVISKTLKIAGDRFDQDIVNYVRDELKLVISNEMAEEAKISIFSITNETNEKNFILKGRDVITGLPKQVYITPTQIKQALQESIEIIVNNIKDIIETSPPEIVSDILNQGIYLSGGGSLIKNLASEIEKETGLRTTLVENPLTATIDGIGKVLENFDYYKKYLEVL
jgi:rod shape-determining protein MreB